MDITAPYQSKRTTPKDAVAAITSGSRLSMGMAVTEPPALLGALAGNLTYGYDADGRVIDEGGSFARINMPPTITATYTKTDQINVFNNVTAMSDPASNLTQDPATMATYSWDSRNQLSSVSGSAAMTVTYDALRRRRQSMSGILATTYVHDGSAVVHSAIAVSTNDMLMLPGSGEVVAFANTVPGTTSNWVPLHDLNGSVIGHVDSTGSVANSFTYDPDGTPTVTGASIPDPYEFAGIEMDPTGLYYEGDYYSPRLVRSISEIGPTNASGGGGGGSGGGGGGSGGGSGFDPSELLNFPGTPPDSPVSPGGPHIGGLTPAKTAQNAQFGTAGLVGGAIIGASVGAPLAGAVLGDLFITGILDFIDLFGGSDQPTLTRKQLKIPSPVVAHLIGVSVVDVALRQVAAADAPSNGTPLQQVPNPAPSSPAQPRAGESNGQRYWHCVATELASPLVIFPIVCPPATVGCLNLGAPGFNALSCEVALGSCGITAAMIASCRSGVAGPQ